MMIEVLMRSVFELDQDGAHVVHAVEIATVLGDKFI